VDSQNIPDFDSTSATSAYSRAAAPGSLNPSFNSTVGSVPGIDALLFRVSFDHSSPDRRGAQAELIAP
jgi:hypothetical protein